MTQKYYILPILLLFGSFVFSQEKERDTLGTEEITVVKSYSPTIKDAFKIKRSPVIDSSDTNEKKEVDYSIYSVPVASTFSPVKGRAKTIRKAPKERFYRNFASLGYGNYSTPLAEVFMSSSTTSLNEFGGFLNYHSSKGGIEGVRLDDNFSTVGLDLFYKQNSNTNKWQSDIGYKRSARNWYGLSEDINYTKAVINSIDESQTYNEAFLEADIEFFNAYARNGKVAVNYFFDALKSAEIYGLFDGAVDIPVGESVISTDISLAYLGTNFKSNYEVSDEITSSFLNLGISPTYKLENDRITLDIGVKMYYSVADNEVGSKFYVYPNITGTYEISEGMLFAYGGVTGGLQQNSYRNFATINPFVSPTLSIQRTDQKYNAYAGIKGLLNPIVRFNLKASYLTEENKALYRINQSLTDGKTHVSRGYTAGNSFDVVYDNVNTINVYGELVVDYSKALKFGANLEFNSYIMDEQLEAWNLPMVKSTILASYTYDQFFFKMEMFFASERKDLFQAPGTTDDLKLLTNAAYFDINISGRYHITDKLEAFVNFNNVLGSNYQEYTNFSVQGFQFLGGMKYRFNM